MLTVVVEIAWRNDEILFFWSLNMKITRILAENSLHIHNCGVRNNTWEWEKDWPCHKIIFRRQITSHIYMSYISLQSTIYFYRTFSKKDNIWKLFQNLSVSKEFWRDHYFNSLSKMATELSGVQFGCKSNEWFPNQTSGQCDLDSKSQACFQTKIARPAVTLSLYYFFMESRNLFA